VLGVDFKKFPEGEKFVVALEQLNIVLHERRKGETTLQGVVTQNCVR
jgi:hypothetical protein